MGIHEVKAEMRRAVYLDRDGVINRALEKESKSADKFE
jgi:histidinol phosphatase-like enzyme